jgi:hypothetical protein
MERKLLDLNFSCSGKGIHLLADAVTIKKEKPLIDMMDIYYEVSRKRKMTISNVERCIRYCIKNSDNKYKKFKNSEAITALAIEL